MVVSSCKFLSNFVLNPTYSFAIRMDDTTFLATWDDTDNIGIVSLTKAELKEFTTSTGPNNGEHITSMLKKILFSFVSCVCRCQKSDKKC